MTARTGSRGLLQAHAFAAGLGAIAEAAAQEPNFPTRPIRFIAANSPGGGFYVTARAISPKLSAAFVVSGGR